MSLGKVFKWIHKADSAIDHVRELEAVWPHVRGKVVVLAANDADVVRLLTAIEGLIALFHRR